MRDAAKQSATLAEQERIRAEEGFRQAREAVEKYLTQISESPDLKAHGLEPLRKQLLETARGYYERFATEHSGDATLQDEVVGARQRLASISRELGDFARAEELYLQTIATLEQLVQENPRTATYRDRLAGSSRLLAGLYRETKRNDEAEPFYKRAVVLREQLVREDSSDVKYRHGLADCHNGLGLLHASLRRFEDARAEYSEACKLWDELKREQPGNPDYIGAFAGLHLNIGELHRALGRNDEAREAYDEARIGFDELDGRFTSPSATDLAEIVFLGKLPKLLNGNAFWRQGSLPCPKLGRSCCCRCNARSCRCWSVPVLRHKRWPAAHG